MSDNIFTSFYVLSLFVAPSKRTVDTSEQVDFTVKEKNGKC